MSYFDSKECGYDDRVPPQSCFAAFEAIITLFPKNSQPVFTAAFTASSRAIFCRTLVWETHPVFAPKVDKYKLLFLG